MPTALLTDPNLVVVVTILTVGAMVKAWISFRKAHLHEKSTTDRFTKALEGSSPQQRPEIIRALGTIVESPVDPVTRGQLDADDAADQREKKSIFAWLMRRWRNPPPAKD